MILPFFPKRFSRLIEPFAGMAAISIATAREKLCDNFVINDINEPLLSILRNAIQEPSALISAYTEIWQEQFSYDGGAEAHYYHVRAKFNSGQKDAATMLYLLARCVKGAVRYSSNGDFNQSPDKRRNGTSPAKLAQNVNLISMLLKDKCSFAAQDYREVLAQAKCGDVIYMDPPYQGVCTNRDSRYFSGIDSCDLISSLYQLNSKGIDYILSYDGFCGNKKYGNDLPEDLGLRKIYIDAGISTQSLFNGQVCRTREALYISSGLIAKRASRHRQLQLFLP